VKNLKNELERLKAEVRVRMAQEVQRQKVGMEQESANARARVSGFKAEQEAEKQNIDMLKNRYRAEVSTPALATKEKAILEAKAEVSGWREVARAEIEQLAVTLKTMETAGGEARRAWILDNFEKLFGPFAATLARYPTDHVSVVTGSGGDREPISAIHPNAVAAARNDIVAAALEGMTKPQPKKAGLVDGGKNP
jgi:hypothetical protein